MIVGIRNVTDIIPARQAFLMKLDCGAIKFARTPIDDPPRIDPTKIKTPSPFQYQIS